MKKAIGDGYVLPKDRTNAELFSDRANCNSVPVILGSNRDETKMFRMWDDAFINTFLGLPTALKNEAGYERINRYGSDLWKIEGVDSFAGLEQYCEAYRTLFARWSPSASKKDSFVQSEHEELGNGGCN